MSVRGRRAVVTALLSCISVPLAVAGIDEGEAVRRALERDPVLREATLAAVREGAESEVATRFPDPRLGWSRESAAETTETFVTFEQELPIDGALGPRRRAALARREAAQASAAWARVSAVREARLAFHALRFRHSEVRLLDDARQRLERFVAALRAREAAGDVSAYDRLRAEREMALLDVELARANGELVAARAALAARLGEPGAGNALEAVNRELPAGPGSVDDIVAEAAAARPDLRAASRTATRLEEESVAAGRARLPIPTAVVGRKSVEEPGFSDDGAIVGVTVSLPIFDGRRPAAAASVAAKESAIGARVALAVRVESEARAAHARESAARAAWEGWKPQAARALELSRIASVAYDEGEIGILERIDAARGLLEASRRGLELEHEVFRTSIELDFAMGREAGR